MSKKAIAVTRTVTNTVTGQSVVYKQIMDAVMYLNIGVSNAGHHRFFLDAKGHIQVTMDEYEQLLNELSEHIHIIQEDNR